jgi:hypothetical protein
VTSKPELLGLSDFLHGTTPPNDGARIFDRTSITVNEIFVDNPKAREQTARPLAHEHAYDTNLF